MRAVQFEQYGDYDQLKLVELPEPVPADGEVLVRMAAAAVNPFDNTVRLGRAGGHQPPLVPGNEGAGTVVQSRNPDLPVGTRVMLVGTFGFARGGTWQELVTASGAEAVKTPSAIDDVTAAATPVAYLAAEMALRVGCQLKPGQTILIPGVGGSVANAAIQLAKAKGAGRVISSSSRTDKVEQAHALGIDDVVDLSRETLSEGVMRLTDGKGVEIALDSVGGDITGQALASLAGGGKVVHMGYPGGTELKVDSMAFIWKPASIHGFNMYFLPPEEFGTAWATILPLLEDGTLKPLVARTYPLEQAAEAQRYLIEGRPMGKVVLTL